MRNYLGGTFTSSFLLIKKNTEKPITENILQENFIEISLKTKRFLLDK